MTEATFSIYKIKDVLTSAILRVMNNKIPRVPQEETRTFHRCLPVGKLDISSLTKTL